MIEKILEKLSRNLDDKKIPYMIIGGQAVLLYGTPRLTRDIDITLGIDSGQVNRILALCRELNLKVLPENPEKFADETNVLPAEYPESNMRVDFIFSFTPYETHAMKRAKEVVISGYPVKFAAPEDVIIHKMFAGRALDEEDVKNILLKMKNNMDFIYIRKWLNDFKDVPGQEDIVRKFERIISEVKD